MAALVCTDDRYLKAEGLPLSITKGCVPVDTAVYDVRKQIETIGSARAAVYSSVFGPGESGQKEYSPVAHVARGMGIPPFLILHVADRPDSKAESMLFADRQKDAGVSVKVFAAEGKTHGTINADLGRPDDKPTQALDEFLDDVLKK